MDLKKVAKGLGDGIVSVGKGAHDAVERYGTWVQETNKRLEEERMAAEENGDVQNESKSDAPSVKSLETLPSTQKEMIYEAVGHKCEKCRKTFKDKPHYLEIHQLDSAGGQEPENILVVCSFCHRDLDTQDDSSSQHKYLDNRTISVNKKIGVILQSVDYKQPTKPAEDKKHQPFEIGGRFGGFGSKPVDLGSDSVQKYLENNYLFGKKSEPPKADPKPPDDKKDQKKPSTTNRKKSQPKAKPKANPRTKPVAKKVRGSPKALIGHKLTRTQLNVAKEKGFVYIQYGGKNIKVLVENINPRTGEIKK